MSSTKNKGKSASNPATRAKSTSSLSKPPSLSTAAPVHPNLSGFNPSHTHYASINPSGSGSGQRLRCWDISTSQIVADWELPNQDAAGKGKAKATSLVWGHMASDTQGKGAEGEDEDIDMDGSAKKKRKTKNGSSAVNGSHEASADDVVVISQGAKLLFFIVGTDRPLSSLSLSGPVSCMAYLQTSSGGKADSGYIVAVVGNDLVIYSLATRSAITQKPLPVDATHKTTTVTVVKQTSQAMTVALAGTSLLLASIPFPLPASPSTQLPITFSAEENVSVQTVRNILPLPSLEQHDTSSVFLISEEDSRTATVWRSNFPAGTARPFETIANISLPGFSPIHTVSATSISQPESGVDVFLTTVAGETSILQITPATIDPSSAAALTETNTNHLSSKKSKKRKSAPIPHLEPTGRIAVSSADGSATSSAYGIVSVTGFGSEEKAGSNGMDIDETAVAGRVTVGWTGSIGRIKWESVVRCPLIPPASSSSTNGLRILDTIALSGRSWRDHFRRALEAQWPRPDRQPDERRGQCSLQVHCNKS